MNTAAEKGAIKSITTHYIDGAFVESHGQEVMDVIRPTDGQVIARVRLADEEDTRRAIVAARRAFATFGRTTKEERASTLHRLHQAVSARIDDLTAAMVGEYGGARALTTTTGTDRQTTNVTRLFDLMVSNSHRRLERVGARSDCT